MSDAPEETLPEPRRDRRKIWALGLGAIVLAAIVAAALLRGGDDVRNLTAKVERGRSSTRSTRRARSTR